MSDLYAYTEEFCKGSPCVGDCDHCPKRDMALEAEEEEELDGN